MGKEVAFSAPAAALNISPNSECEIVRVDHEWIAKQAALAAKKGGAKLNALESKWDRSKRLVRRFEAWCWNVAAALGGAVKASRLPENVTHWNVVCLTDGLTFSLHLNGYESKVSVSGDWPKDCNNQTVTPRDATSYKTEPANIHVGTGRDPAAAKDIARRFLPVYRTQYAACLERVAGRNEYQRTVEDNAKRIAAVLGLPASDVKIEGGEARLYPHREGLHGVHVSSEVRFELRLSVEKAEQVLRVLEQLAREETEASK